MSIRLVIVGLMMVTALAFGLIAFQLASPPRVPNAITALSPLPAPLTVAYLVAGHAITTGTLTRPEDFIVKTAAPDRIPADAIRDTPEARADLRGSLIQRYMETGTPLTTADLIRPRDRGFLAAVLAKGTRAVSVGVDAVTGVAGLIWPGDRVDVILTQDIQQTANRHLFTSETVLTNVRVIAVDQTIAQGAPVNGAAVGHLAATVTVQATDDQAEKLAVAIRLGRLSLAVRAANDDTPPSAGVVQAVSGDDVSPALSRANLAAGGTRIQLIQGEQRSEVNFR